MTSRTWGQRGPTPVTRPGPSASPPAVQDDGRLRDYDPSTQEGFLSIGELSWPAIAERCRREIE